MIPTEGGLNILKLKIPLAPKAPKQNFGCHAQTLEGEEGGGGLLRCTAFLIHPSPGAIGRLHCIPCIPCCSVFSPPFFTDFSTGFQNANPLVFPTCVFSLPNPHPNLSFWAASPTRQTPRKGDPKGRAGHSNWLGLASRSPKPCPHIRSDLALASAKSNVIGRSWIFLR